MNLQCLNTIITENLAIQIDLNDIKSWNYNTDFTVISLNKWNNAKANDLNLYDFGLTAYDNGRLNKMYSGITLTQNDNKIKLFRVGYNTATGGTYYSGYTITALTGTSVGNYFYLNGGYLQGYFKLENYNYQLLPSRYNKGITIETIIEILPQSSGIFFLMGTRAEDKYNPYFSGETGIVSTTNIPYDGNKVGHDYRFSGVTTSENHYLVSYDEKLVRESSFKQPELSETVILNDVIQADNIVDNVISFEITDEKKLKYKYIDSTGNLVQNESPTIIYRVGWTIIDIVFSPYDAINNYDESIYLCYPRRKGDLSFYLNGRLFWKISDFDEFYFRGLNNDKEKQLGVPYNISWGGGSFGLKHSWHYDNKEYIIYTGQTKQYIDDNFWIQGTPLSTKCDPNPSSDYLPGLLLSADTTTFTINTECNPTVYNPLTVMSVEYTGSTVTSATTYFIKFNQPISVLSNREYEIDLSFYNSGFFKKYDINNYQVLSKASIIVYGTTDIDIVNQITYSNPISMSDLIDPNQLGLHPFPDRDEYEYLINGVMYYGKTGVPVIDGDIISNEGISIGGGNITTGENGWKSLKCVFKTKNNSKLQTVYIGLLLESTDKFELNKPIYLSNFIYKGQDVLAQDENKNNLYIQKYFDSSYVGNIQKLRVYNTALLPSEVLHNTIIEANNAGAYGILVSKGGRIINTYQNIPYIPQQSSGSDIRKSIKYRNNDGSFKNLFQMIDILVVIKSRSNPNVELVKFKKVAASGWLALIYMNDTTYDFIVPDTITSQHPNEILFAEVKFQWADPNDIDNVFDKIFVTNIITSTLLNNTVKNY